MANIIDGTAATEILVGTEENDLITTNGGADTVYGFGGNDTLVQQGGTASALFGGMGNDVYVVLDGGISISEFGGGGLDTLRTRVTMTAALPDGIENIENINFSSALTLRGNSLNNRIICGAASDAVFGGGGNDFIFGSQVNISSLNGEGGNDRLIGGNQAVFGDILDGGSGNDILEGRVGPDGLDGGAGNDTYILANDTTDVIADASGIDTITSTISRNLASHAAIENLTLLGTAGAGTGNNLNNVIAGNAVANVLSGGIGADRLLGNGGNDRLVGGPGIDTLTGGANNDAFVFNAPLSNANRDTVTDFFAPQDVFLLENAVMAKLGAGVHALNQAFFRPAAAAADANDYVIYNKATGYLSYDSNGNGAGGITLLAVLTNKPVLTAGDFYVI